MTKLITMALAVLLTTTLLHAQSINHGSDPANLPEKHNDSVILADVILPLVQRASNDQEAPDWQVLGRQISTKYGESYVDRSVTKAKIYYYYGKDWPLFSKALVHFTDKYEDKEDLKLMNKNAKMVLQFSQNTDELKAALTWIKHAIEKEPGNSEYKETYDGLATKIKTAMAKS